MKFLLPALSFFLVLNAVAQQPAATAKPKKAPNAILDPVKDVAGLPRVLIIGDSISMGYTGPVRKLLEGKANVHRIPANGGPTKNGVANIEKWLGTSKWDVIHFNWGIHDLKHMPDGKRQVEPADYEANLRKLVARLKQTGAKLIWASTTPIPEGELNPQRTFGKVPEYNEIAAKVMTENGVTINDLNGWMTPRFEEFHKPKDLHYTDAGSQHLAHKVAESITQAMVR